MGVDGIGLTDEQLKTFEENGYLVVENYYDAELCDELRRECSKMIDAMNPDDHRTVFSSSKHEQMKENYFLTSGDKIRFFWEQEAVNDAGDLIVPKHRALNKMGHAFHVLNPAFKAATYNEKLASILRSMGYKRPTIPQSMYIFKQPNIGGNVVKHIDASFLESTPLKLTGFWIALEDATLENGCLWFAPGSHKDVEVTYRMVRNPDPKSSQLLTFEGKLEELSDDKYVSVPVKKGAMVIIDGKVQHKSAKNVSDKSRHIYTFHVTESHEAVWSKRNWLQPTDQNPFPPVYEPESACGQ